MTVTLAPIASTGRRYAGNGGAVIIIDLRARPEIEGFASITRNPIFNAFVQGRGYDIARRTTWSPT
ncbi:MAG: hypothetical protein FJX57_25655 [Alphaproteobacteria bacterium]|nr:hypothetical protein [Alphaproteobacteria bacterium]